MTEKPFKFLQVFNFLKDYLILIIIFGVGSCACG